VKFGQADKYSQGYSVIFHGGRGKSWIFVTKRVGTMVNTGLLPCYSALYLLPQSGHPLLPYGVPMVVKRLNTDTVLSHIDSAIVAAVV